MTWRQSLAAFFSLMLGLIVVTSAAARQPAADPLKELNDSLLLPGTKDATEALFAPLAAMKAPPASPAELRAVSMLTSTDKNWGEWESWAAGETQQAVLAAMKTITDPKSKYVLALRFGKNEAKPEWISAGLFIDVGEPPLIALAPRGMAYLDRLDDVAKLCTVEAERLAIQKKPEECIAVLVNWLRFARIIADRPFAKEKVWGLKRAENALERLADIACAHPDLFKEKHIQDTTRELDPRALSNERIRFPIGERLALKQLIALTLDERGGPKADAFGPALGRLTADPKNPFDLFPQSAWWSEIAKQHAGWFDARDMADKVLNDWQKRWELNNIFDMIMETPTDYSKMDLLKFAMIDHVVREIPALFVLRTSVLTQLGGVRSALGVVGYRAAQGQWPPTLSAVQPRFVQTLDTDPWFFEEEREVRDFFRYFVPVRDQPLKPRELPKPHAVRVDLSGAGAAPGGGAQASQLENLNLDVLSDIAREVYDPVTALIDEAKLKEKWTEAAKDEMKKTFSDQLMLELFTQSIRLAKDVTPDQIASVTAAAFDAPGARSALEVEAQRLGLTVDELKDMTVKSISGLFGSEAYTALRTSVNANQTPTLEQLEAFGAATVEIMTGPEIYDPFVKKVIPALANPASVATGPSITAHLTEKDFILYSVGPDMKADFARNVGRAGPDILIWPPVLTLERRALTGN